MARKSVVPEILAALELYINGKAAEYEAMPDDAKVPTLPVNPKDPTKVNVREIVREIGLKPSAQQHFFNKPELRDAVNLECEAQGINGVSSRVMDQETAEVVKGKIAVMSGVNKKANEELVEALHRNDLLTQENHSLRIQVEQLQAQIDSIYTSGDILIKEVP